MLKEDINTDLSIMQSHLDGVLDQMQKNNLTLKRLQAFETKLLGLNSLPEMIAYVLNDTRIFFDLDEISLCLIDEKNEIAGFLNDDGYDYQKNNRLVLLKDKELLLSTFGISPHPFLGAYKQSSCAGFFPKLDRKPTSVAIIPLSRRGQYLGSFNLGSYSSKRFIAGMAIDHIEHAISIIAICLENNLNYEMMRRSSLMDTLTGVNNRRFFEQRIGEEIYRSQRNNQPLSCLFLDIDHFKQVNDTYGHLAGDYVLALVAEAIKKLLRNNDILARYGGEEFIALLSNIEENKVEDIAERIRNSIKQLSIIYSKQTINVTISIGLSIYQPGHSPEMSTTEIATQLIHSADTALYSAKESGRDRIATGTPVFDHAMNDQKVS